MSRLSWGDAGERYYEAGIDRGVLYPDTGPGVVWNGLTAVSEKVEGGKSQPYYVDGYKYFNLATAEEFAATIEAYSAPREFAACDGSVSVRNGLFLTQQRRKSFGLTYRTKVGNDLDGIDHGYKIHIVYNALAEPASRNNQSMSSTPNPTQLSWDVSTMAPRITGYRPTAHFMIDSTQTPEALLRVIENILYGAISSDPRLPSASELIGWFDGYLMLELIADHDIGPDTSPVPAFISDVAPILEAGEQVLWLQTFPGVDFATPKLVTGD